mmetsp:Transcript_76414/g.224181  ORF Transcript_76414/g.224181 Transcript_76414/m.224181 type:complete len:202 (-) Transcript_76414:206-811(-)
MVLSGSLLFALALSDKLAYTSTALSRSASHSGPTVTACASTFKSTRFTARVVPDLALRSALRSMYHELTSCWSASLRLCGLQSELLFSAICLRAFRVAVSQASTFARTARASAKSAAGHSNCARDSRARISRGSFNNLSSRSASPVMLRSSAMLVFPVSLSRNAATSKRRDPTASSCFRILVNTSRSTSFSGSVIVSSRLE